MEGLVKCWLAVAADKVIATGKVRPTAPEELALGIIPADPWPKMINATRPIGSLQVAFIQ